MNHSAFQSKTKIRVFFFPIRASSFQSEIHLKQQKYKRKADHLIHSKQSTWIDVTEYIISFFFGLHEHRKTIEPDEQRNRQNFTFKETL